jgi:hypothetical protein
MPDYCKSHAVQGSRPPFALLSRPPRSPIFPGLEPEMTDEGSALFLKEHTQSGDGAVGGVAAGGQTHGCAWGD